MWACGGTLQANACSAVERPISSPCGVTAALFDMFCGLNGLTAKPRFVSNRHKPATSTVLPTSEPQPWIMIAGMGLVRKKGLAVGDQLVMVFS